MITRAALLLVASFALIAGCGSEEGGGDGGDDPLAALDAAATKAQDVKSYRQTFTMDSDLGGEEFSFDGSGTSTADSTRGRMEGRMKLQGQEIEFEGILADGVMYLKGDGFGVPDGKWLKTNDPPTSTMSPAEFVGFLKDSDGVERVGSETVRGEETTHYRGPLDLKRLAEESGTEIVERLRNTPEAEKFKIIVDVWVRDDGLPARLGLDMTAPGQAEGSIKMTSDIVEYDVPVNAEPPPAGQVVESSG